MAVEDIMFMIVGGIGAVIGILIFVVIRPALSNDLISGSTNIMLALVPLIIAAIVIIKFVLLTQNVEQQQQF